MLFDQSPTFLRYHKLINGSGKFEFKLYILVFAVALNEDAGKIKSDPKDVVYKWVHSLMLHYWAVIVAGLDIGVMRLIFD